MEHETVLEFNTHTHHDVRNYEDPQRKKKGTICFSENERIQAPINIDLIQFQV